MNRLVPTRWSHLLGYSGVGSLVRAEDDLYVIKDIGHWTDRNGEPTGEIIQYVDLLRATLDIDRELRLPPLARELPKGVIDGTCVPALRFPGWTRCPSCGLLHWRPWPHDKEQAATSGPPRCSCDRRPRLQQVAWVVAHPEGGLREVPWHYLAHQEAGAGRDCRADWEHAYLRLRRDRTGLSWSLSCDRCKASARFDPKGQLAGNVPRKQPWQRADTKASNDSQQKSLILEVNDARLYFPRVRAALVIPPESRIRQGGVLDLLYSNPAHRKELESRRSTLARKGLLRRLADQYGCGVGEIEAAWDEIAKGWPLYGQSVTPGDLLAKEFKALTDPIPDLADGEDFVPRHRTDAWRTLSRPAEDASNEARVLSAVDRLVAVTRLREIRVFMGFTRIAQNFEDGLRPTGAGQGQSGEPVAQLIPPDLDHSQDWLPAIELYGEGIFFTLDETLLQRWAGQPGLKTRTETLQRRLEQTGMRFPDAPALAAHAPFHPAAHPRCIC